MCYIKLVNIVTLLTIIQVEEMDFFKTLYNLL